MELRKLTLESRYALESRVVRRNTPHASCTRISKQNGYVIAIDGPLCQWRYQIYGQTYGSQAAIDSKQRKISARCTPHSLNLLRKNVARNVDERSKGSSNVREQEGEVACTEKIKEASFSAKWCWKDASTENIPLSRLRVVVSRGTGWLSRSLSVNTNFADSFSDSIPSHSNFKQVSMVHGNFLRLTQRERHYRRKWDWVSLSEVTWSSQLTHLRRHHSNQWGHL